MDEGGIFTANLSVGRLGRDVTRLLGATLTGTFSLAALSRADVLPDRRPDFYCYIDEFPLFASGSVDIMLSETGKYRLCLIFAMQYLEQVEPKLLASILGNVGNLIFFRVGAKDAAILERELRPVYNRDDLVNIPYHHAYIRMMIGQKPARPFSAKIPPSTTRPSLRVEMSPEFARFYQNRPRTGACVTESVTLMGGRTSTLRLFGRPRP